MTVPKPSRLMRLGLILGSAGCLLVIVVGGFVMAGVLEGVLSTVLIDFGGAIAVCGALVLGYGGIAYFRRSNRLIGKRENELKAAGGAETGGTSEEGAPQSAAA